MVVVSELSHAHPAKETLGVVRVHLRVVLQAVGFFVVDPMHGTRPLERYRKPASSASSMV